MEPVVGLQQRVVQAIARAQRSGARVELATRSSIVTEGDITFIVHLAESLEQKKTDRPAQGQAPPANPFLPYDPNLWVADIPPHHVCLLNKYYIVAQHLLVVTRRFEPQESPLTAEDFQAWWSVLESCNGLGFYNAGPLAGASQPHKHMQHIPWPAVHVPGRLLVEWYDKWAEPGQVREVPQLPFRHALAAWRSQQCDSGDWAHELGSWYGRLLETLGIERVTRDKQELLGPYNLLLTRRWMLLVPRTRDGIEGISLNAMAYAGSLLAPNEEAFERIRQRGPLAFLTDASR
ncbi:MAG: hypothetical protein KatS3mg110_2665 [Pirellulaceae bacterium]|nr:MAG: hypothetical protein KatS3mg110_2665 [Pirellulaceae bacterium]